MSIRSDHRATPGPAARRNAPTAMERHITRMNIDEDGGERVGMSRRQFVGTDENFFSREDGFVIIMCSIEIDVYLFSASYMLNDSFPSEPRCPSPVTITRSCRLRRRNSDSSHDGHGQKFNRPVRDPRADAKRPKRGR